MVVTKLGSSEPVGEAEVEASNWMGALRGAREQLGESGSIPPGASCNVDTDGGATLLDPVSRRRFELKPLGPVDVGAASVPAPEATSGAPPSAAPEPASAPTATAPGRKARFQTVAYTPGMALPTAADASSAPPAASAPQPQPAAQPPVVVSAPAPLATTPEPAPQAAAPEPAPQAAAPEPAAQPGARKKRFQTVAFSDGMALPSMPGASPPAAAAPAQVAPAPPAPAQPPAEIASEPASPAPRERSQTPIERKVPLEQGGGLEPLLEINDEPTPQNPLCYRERAFAAPPGMSLSDAEAALRWKLADMQKQLADLPKGKLVNLAVFDHHWTDRPNRPPIIVLQWRDWRDEISVDFPAAQVQSVAPQAPAQEDALAELFEALHDLAHMTSAADGLRFAVSLLERAVPSEAYAACLYDINTDELRFVAVAGVGAESMQGRAIPRTAGLFGQAARMEDRTTVYPDVLLEPSFDSDLDTRPGLDARNMLFRPVTHEGHLLGMLQMINRKDAAGFLEQDLHLVSYLSERLAEFLQEAKFRRRSEPPRPPR